MSIARSLEVVLPDGRLVSAEVRPSSRARIARIRVGAQAPLQIVVPEGIGDAEAGAALARKAGWIARKLEEIEELRSRHGTLGLDRPGVVWIAGEAHEVRGCADGLRSPRLRAGVLEVPRAGRREMEQAVERWYRRAARAALQAAVEEEGKRFELMGGTIAIRDQRTRWGSRSSSGALSFNWRLVVAPEAVLQYVVVHELVHARVPNHSRQFWRAVHAAMPNWEREAAWLRAHGEELREYRPAVSVALHPRLPSDLWLTPGLSAGAS